MRNALGFPSARERRIFWVREISAHRKPCRSWLRSYLTFSICEDWRQVAAQPDLQNAKRKAHSASRPCRSSIFIPKRRTSEGVWLYILLRPRILLHRKHPAAMRANFSVNFTPRYRKELWLVAQIASTRGVIVLISSSLALVSAARSDFSFWVLHL
jgi:hypothetical protein